MNSDMFKQGLVQSHLGLESQVVRPTANTSEQQPKHKISDEK